ncbi:hypothetical protein T440DRAFT_391811 [Plenodomus tracheiphilus IPT5]|uniref:Uncharacterized protein n=1 Tax=Plenodomus tracheiphilus IPT5 TaxID=1408161 RepID=A0A6A7BCE5_9PLEO|nr:hypothetical protein T440DRAFT_391811 [Plenodomus tracheiphilus IPT5]
MWDRRLRTREPITVMSHRDHINLQPIPQPLTLTVGPRHPELLQPPPVYITHQTKATRYPSTTTLDTYL